MKRLRFRQRQHLRKPAEFKRVYALRCVARQRNLTVFAAPNGREETRIGMSVSRQHGGAVFRNRLKRLLRDAFRLERHELPAGLDLVLIPEQARDVTLLEFRSALAKAVSRLARRLAERDAKERPRDADPAAMP